VIDIPVPVALASASPARRRLLGRLLGDFEVVEPQVDEKTISGPGAREATVLLAEAKAREVAGRRPKSLVIAADTLVECRGEVIGKPLNRQDAIRILQMLTRWPHHVLTGLCVRAPDGRERSCRVETTLRMRPMSRHQIEDCVDGPGSLERAGVYGLQEDDPNVQEISGSASSVMGLPLEALSTILRELYPQGGHGG
jgi:septum formation protein